MRINVAAACALILPSACAVLVGCQGWIAIGYFKGGVPDELQTLPFERVLPYVDRTVFAVAALALGVKCLGYVRRAVRSLHAGRVSSADVLRRLALEVSGQATKTVFSGRIRDRETRVEAVEHRLLPGRYRIEIESTIGMPLRAEIPGTASLDRLAEKARVGGRREPRLRALADSLTDSREHWGTLFRIFRVDTVRFSGGRIRASAPMGTGLSAADEADRVLRLVERLIAVTGVVGSILAVEARACAESRCPYCHDDLGEQAKAACARCGTEHHEECLEEHGGCSVFGCGFSLPAPSPRGAGGGPGRGAGGPALTSARRRGP